ncbi:hypothetical protein [Paraflavitalea pollutisoli]|uniref:hypothetical protein n=1 Tax=Paraflavitalea pollutisoli TaxID=3034143 RepID=UPI0023EAA905|nr:hypothetical protein [Paraflavitalea sp. H1-2-19X]
MRTSNKLLSGLILTGLLLIAGLFIFVRVQVARGATVTRAVAGQDRYWANVHKIDGPVRSVSIIGLKNITLVPADSARLEIDKNFPKGIFWKLDNGRLTLTIDTSSKNSYSSNVHVELFLPATDSIIADYSNIDVKNTGDSTTAAAFHFMLSGSTVAIQSDDRDPAHKPVTYYQSLQFDARNGSEVKLHSDVTVGKFSVKLRGSTLEVTEDHIRFNEKPTIQTDSISQLHLTGSTLRQALITSTE